jgi:hypothetical protein
LKDDNGNVVNSRDPASITPASTMVFPFTDDDLAPAEGETDKYFYRNLWLTGTFNNHPLKGWIIR